MSKYKLKHLMCNFGSHGHQIKDQLDIPWQGWTYMTYPNAATLATSCVSVVVGTADRGQVRGKGRHISPYGSPYIHVNWFPISSVTLQSVWQLVKPLLLFICWWFIDSSNQTKTSKKAKNVRCNCKCDRWCMTSDNKPSAPHCNLSSRLTHDYSGDRWEKVRRSVQHLMTSSFFKIYD